MVLTHSLFPIIFPLSVGPGPTLRWKVGGQRHNKFYFGVVRCSWFSKHIQFEYLLQVTTSRKKIAGWDTLPDIRQLRSSDGILLAVVHLSMTWFQSLMCWDLEDSSFFIICLLKLFLSFYFKKFIYLFLSFYSKTAILLLSFIYKIFKNVISQCL